MPRVRLPLFLQPSKSATVDSEATKGATIGKDLHNPDGSLFDPSTIQGTTNTLPADGETVPASRIVIGADSIVGGGDLGADRTLQLDGDSAAPGPSKVYGTDPAGVRGWQNPASVATGYFDGGYSNTAYAGTAVIDAGTSA